MNRNKVEIRNIIPTFVSNSDLEPWKKNEKIGYSIEKLVPTIRPLRTKRLRSSHPIKRVIKKANRTDILSFFKSLPRIFFISSEIKIID